MANIQWNRHINKLCEHQGGHRYDDMLIGCIAAFHQKGRSSEKQGEWLVRQLDMHYGIQVAHHGAIQMTKAQRRPIKEAVDWTNAHASSGRMAYLNGRFPHTFHTVSTRFPHSFHTKGANSSVDTTTYEVTIAKLLLKLIDAPLAHSRPSATPNGPSVDFVDGGSLVARHSEERDVICPIGMNDNVIDDAAAPLRGFAAKSDEPLERKREPLGGNEEFATWAKANRTAAQVKANSKATISLWVAGSSRSYVRGQLEVGDKKYRVNFRSPRHVEELVYVERGQDVEARQWYEAVSSQVIPFWLDKAEAAEGRLARKHVASAIHEFQDRNCEGHGVNCGIAFMGYRGDVPSRCIVQLNGTDWKFDLQPIRSAKLKSPQYKATAERSSAAA
ncbi:conserved hypothetical protein [Magnetospirillum sp. LM-5]|uniref:hypothetical protein n=1 Tax=Magnetospirillum sp. LM-5 TaxID=2681466 RepID=UPI001384A067|nr:hypothetical protein [Magnetospirillum sp. LM-5]CAA7614692.1 conserved hypothetical protein [Magnetospirillum sp. LM-5]